MTKLTFILLITLLFSCKQKAVKKDQIIFDRIEFVYNLKETIDEDVWKSFTNKAFDVPLIYYTDTSSYIANPTDKFLSTISSTLVHETKYLKIYKTATLLDSIPFHMETGMTLGDSTDEYNYHSPFMTCSSVETAKEKIPVLQSTEQWATMIMHEYFHGFQYKHASYIRYYEDSIVHIQPDSLHAIYKNNTWFKASIDTENNLLLYAIVEKDSTKKNKIIDSFFSIRNERRKRTKQTLHFDIANYEKCYETMEGTARYVEYSLYKKFSSRSEDKKLVKSDTLYKSFAQYKKYNIENDPWLFLTGKTTYFYAVGFNMARLLDKLNVEYKSKLFIQENLSLEDLLKNR